MATAVVAAVTDALVEYGVSEALAYVVATVVVNVGISYAISAIMAPSGGFTAEAQARTHIVRSSVQPRNIVYGEVVTSGPLVFVASTDKGGDKNKFLHMIIVLAAHEVNAITDVYFNDDILQLDANGYVTSGKYYNNNRASYVQTTAAAAGATTLTVPLPITNLISVTMPVAAGSEDRSFYAGQTRHAAVTATYSGSTVTIPSQAVATTYTVNYESDSGAGLVRIKKHLGGMAQIADPYLIAECPALWTKNHILCGCAYLYVRLEFDQTAFATGIPNIKARVQGKNRIYDPRNASYGYTTNYALCMNDYMRSVDGLGCAIDDIDQASLMASANICDEEVTLDASGHTQKRYPIHGVVSLDHAPEENIRAMASAGGGPVPVLAGGVFYIHVGAYDTPVVSLSESDLRGPVKVRPRTPRKDLFNAVKGTYIDGDNGTFQPVDYPMVRNATYKAQDADVEIVRDLQLPFTTNGITAQRLAKISLERSRQGVTVEFPCKVSGFKLSAWDTVQVSLSKFGWKNKIFRVISWSFNTDSGVDLVLQEDAAGVYDWNYGDQTAIDLAPDTTLPAPAIVTAIASLTLTSGTNELVLSETGITSRIHAFWPLPSSSAQYHGGKISVEYKKAIDTAWTALPPMDGHATVCYLSPVEDGALYLVRIRLQSNLGALSAWTYAAPHIVVGKTAPPPNVTGFALSILADGTRRFSFDVVNQPVDVAHGGGYRIKYRVSGTGTPWANMTALKNGLITESPFETNAPAADTYDFAMVAVDQSTNESAVPAFISSAVIGSEPVTYGAASNLLSNSDFVLFTGTNTGAAALYGWTYRRTDNVTGESIGRNYAPWNTGVGGAWWHTVSPTGGTALTYLEQTGIPVSAGRQYELSAFVAPHRCKAIITLIFLNASNGYISEFSDSYDAGNATTGGVYSPMIQLWLKVTAPAGAVTAVVHLRKQSTNGGNQDSYIFWNRVMLCDSTPFPAASRQSPTPWIDAGIDALHGGGIEAGTVGTIQITNNAATDVIAATASNVPVAYYSATETTIASITYTAPVTGTVVMTLTGEVKNTYHSVGGGGGPYIYLGSGIRIYQSVTGAASHNMEIPNYAPSVSLLGTFSRNCIFTVTAGTTYVFYALIYNRFNGSDTVVNSAELVLEAIKK